MNVVGRNNLRQGIRSIKARQISRIQWVIILVSLTCFSSLLARKPKSKDRGFEKEAFHTTGTPFNCPIVRLIANTRAPIKERRKKRQKKHLLLCMAKRNSIFSILLPGKGEGGGSNSEV